MSCFFDQFPYLSITNGYEFDVKVTYIVNARNKTYEQSATIIANKTIRFEYYSLLYDNRVISIRVETLDNILLAEYTPEYVYSLQKVYRRYTDNSRPWIFTEKGLFVITDKVYEKYNDILAYYRSDEAVQDLQKLLETK
jgi:hypothetical protein